MLKHLPFPLLGLAFTVPALGAQQKLALTRPTAALEEPFTNLRSVRELPDGRLLAADVTDKVVRLIDLERNSFVQVGREGQGPEEYLLPFALFGTGNGGAVLLDMGNRRFLEIGPDGKIGKSFSPPNPPAAEGDAAGRRRMMLAGGLLDVRSSDSRGNLYLQGSAISLDAEQDPDSVPIARWHPSQTKMDTVGWVPVTEGMRPRVQRNGGNAMTVRIGDGAAWPRQVQWAVAADGRLVMVTPDPYRVTWISGATRAAGPVVQFAPIKVGDAEKKAYVEQRSRARPMVMTFGGGGRGPAPRIDPPRIEDIEFPETLPAFSGRDAVLVTPEGEVWVSRLRSARDQTPRYDVFDGRGQRIGEVTLRPQSRVVGFGKGTVYVVRSDDDDLQYLERYQKPRL